MKDREFFISLLEDEDEANASIAMKELLDGGEAESVVAENMDADSPLLRKRIQQLSCICNYRRMKEEFPKRVLADELSPWECLSWINVIMDFRASLPQLDGMLEDYTVDMRPVRSMSSFIAMIKDTGLALEDSNDNFITKYLLSDVMVHNSGDSLPVAVIVQRLGEIAGWRTQIGTVNGILCLRDRKSNFVLVTSEMETTTSRSGIFIPMTLRDIAIEELSKILSSACIDQISSAIADSQELLEKLLG